MMEEDIKQVNDRPAERSLNITNVLLALLLIGGGIFGTVVTTFMGTINTSVVSMDKSIGEIQVFNGVTGNDITNIKEDIKDLDSRVHTLEGIK